MRDTRKSCEDPTPWVRPPCTCEHRAGKEASFLEVWAQDKLREIERRTSRRKR